MRKVSLNFIISNGVNDMNDVMKNAITRISQVTWGASEVKKKSSELLITEYLRRSSLF